MTGGDKWASTARFMHGVCSSHFMIQTEPQGSFILDFICSVLSFLLIFRAARVTECLSWQEVLVAQLVTTCPSAVYSLSRFISDPKCLVDVYWHHSGIIFLINLIIYWISLIDISPLRSFSGLWLREWQRTSERCLPLGFALLCCAVLCSVHETLNRYRFSRSSMFNVRCDVMALPKCAV